MDAPPLRHRFGLSIIVIAWAWLAAIPISARAAAIGATPAPEGLRFGILAGAARADVDDPDGATDSKNYTRLALVATLPAAKDRRWLGELCYHRFDIEPGTDTIGVDVTRLGAALSYQARFATLPLKPWLGVGAGISRDEFDERLTVDSLGFVANRYPARSDYALGLLLTATTTWRVGTETDLGLHLQYEQPLSGDVTTLTLGVLLIF